MADEITTDEQELKELNASLPSAEDQAELDQLNAEVKKKSESETSGTDTSISTTPAPKSSMPFGERRVKLGVVPPSISQKFPKKTPQEKKKDEKFESAYTWQPVGIPKEITKTLLGPLYNKKQEEKTSFEIEQEKKTKLLEAPIYKEVVPTGLDEEVATLTTTLLQDVPEKENKGLVYDYLKTVKATDTDLYNELTAKIHQTKNLPESARFDLVQRAIKWKSDIAANDLEIVKARGYEDLAKQLEEKGDKIDVVQKKNEPLLAQWDSLTKELNDLAVQIDGTANPILKNELAVKYNEGVKNFQDMLPQIEQYNAEIEPLQDDYNQFYLKNKESLDKFGVAVNDYMAVQDEQSRNLRNHPETYKNLLKTEGINNYNKILNKYGHAGHIIAHSLNETPKEVWNTLVDAFMGIGELMKDISPTVGEEGYGVLDLAFDKVKDMTDSYIRFSTSTLPMIDKETGKINATRVIPSIAKTATDMGILLVGANKFTAPLKALGLGTTASANAGLIASSFMQTYDDYKHLAQEMGYSEKDAINFSLVSSALTSVLETISPNTIIRGTNIEKIALRDAFKSLTGKDALQKFFQIAIKEPGKEVAQELVQGYADKMVGFFTNVLASDPTKQQMETEMGTPEILETALLTYATTVLMTGGANYINKDAVRQNALMVAAKDYDKFNALITSGIRDGKIDSALGKQLIEEVRTTSLVLSKIPSSVSPQKKQELIPFVTKKMRLEEEIKNADPSFERMLQEQVKALDKQIQTILNKKEDAGKDLTGVPSEKPLGQEPVKAEPLEITGEEKISDGGIFQKKESEEPPELTPEEEQSERERLMAPIAGEMVRVEREMSNKGYEIDTDYDGEITLKNKKTGELVEPEDVPEELRSTVADYEKATKKLTEFDEQSFQKVLAQERNRDLGEEATFEEVKKELPAEEEKERKYVERRLSELKQQEGEYYPELENVYKAAAQKLYRLLKAGGKILVGKVGGVNVYQTGNAQEFRDAMQQAVSKRTETRTSVEVKSTQEYQDILDKGGSLFLAEDGSFGAMVAADGYMGSLFKDPESSHKEVGKALQEIRRKEGGLFFDAFGHGLEDLYIRNGYRPVARVKFNEEYAPPGWEETNLKTKPDVVFFVYDPEGKAKKGEGQYFDDYFDAYKHTQKIANEQEERRQAPETEQRGTEGSGDIKPEDVEYGTRKDVIEKVPEEGEVKQKSPPPPPKEEKKVVAEIKPGKEKSLMNRLFKSKNVSQTTKDKIEKFGLTYQQFTNEESSKIAKEVIEEYGVEAALTLVGDESSYVRGAVRTMVYAEAINHYRTLEEKATTEEEKNKYAELQASVANTLDQVARDAGQRIQAISHFYKLSGHAQEIKIRKDIERVNDEELNKKRGVLGRKKSLRERIQEQKNKLTKETPPEPKKGPARKGNIFTRTTEQRKARIEDLKKRWKGLGPPLTSGGLSPEHLEVAIEIGAEYMALGATTFARWSKKMMKDLGITEQQAKTLWEKERLPKAIDDKQRTLKEVSEQEFMADIKAEKMKVLDKLFPMGPIEKKSERSKEKRKQEFEKILDIIDALTDEQGEINNEQYEKAFYGALGLVDPDNKEVSANIKDFAKRINESEGLYKDRATIEMLDYLNNLKRESRLKLGMPILFANMLYGYETHLRNMQWNLSSAMLFHMGLLVGRNPTYARQLWKSFFKGLGRGATEAKEILAAGYDKTGSPVTERDLLERITKQEWWRMLIPFTLSHYKVPFRALRAADALLGFGMYEAKQKSIMIRDALLRNKELPEDQRKSKKEIEAEVNNLMGDTELRLRQARVQAENETKKFYKIDEPLFVDGKRNEKLSDGKYNHLYRNFRRRVYEIMEESRPQEVRESAREWSERALLLGQPKGYLGAIATSLNTFFGFMPWIKPFTMPFVNVPLNVAGFMFEWSPLGFWSAAFGEGAFIDKDIAKRYKITQELTPDQRKEMIIKATVSSAAMGFIYAMTQMKYDDDEKGERPLLIVYADGTGDYAKNQELKKAGTGFEYYTLDLAGFRMSYKTSPIVAWFAAIGYMGDHERFKSGSEASMAKKMAISLFGHLSFMTEQANLSGFRDLVNVGEQAGAFADDEDKLSKMVSNLQKGGFRALKTLLVPNYVSQANNDIRGVMELNDKRAIEPWQYLVKDMPLLDQMLEDRLDHFGRPVKDEFDIPFYPKPAQPEDPYYKLVLDKGYLNKLKFYNDKTIFLDDKEVEVSRMDVQRINKIRGQYVMDALDDTEEHKQLGGKTTYDYLRELDKEAFEKAFGYLFSQGTWYAKDQIFGQGIWAEKQLEMQEEEDKGQKKELRDFKKMYQYEEGVKFRKEQKRKK